MATISTLYINGQLLFLGIIVEGIKYIRGKYEGAEKVFWLEWIETTFSLWIVGIILIGLVLSIKGFR